MHQHLRNQLYFQTAIYIFGIFVCLSMAVVALFITFWVTYTGIWVGFQWLFPHSHDTRILLSYCFMALVFFSAFRTREDYLQELSFTTGTASKEVVSFYIPNVGFGSNINPLAPDTIHSFAKVLISMMHIGPNMLKYSYLLTLQIVYTIKTDVDSCVQVISILQQNMNKVLASDIYEELPDIHHQSVFFSLSRIQGIYTSDDPYSFILTDTFREELREVNNR